ncbi:MAG: hypothetical protein ACW98K_04525 [Candidatus Kariarchaeaceae archaeon]
MNKTKRLPRLLRVLLICLIITFPFGVLKYAVDTDISSNPPSFEHELVLPPVNGTFYSLSRGKLPVLSHIFFKLTREDISSTILPRGYIMLDYEFKQFASGNTGCGYQPLTKLLPAFNDSFWINLTVTLEVEYFVIITYEGNDVPVTVEVLVWTEISSLLKREAFTIFVTFSLYYILASIASSVIYKIRMKLFRRALARTRKEEEAKYYRTKP